jgi:hypothetical protein
MDEQYENNLPNKSSFLPHLKPLATPSSPIEFRPPTLFWWQPSKPSCMFCPNSLVFMFLFVKFAALCASRPRRRSGHHHQVTKRGRGGGGGVLSIQSSRKPRAEPPPHSHFPALDLLAPSSQSPQQFDFRQQQRRERVWQRRGAGVFVRPRGWGPDPHRAIVQHVRFAAHLAVRGAVPG